MNNKRNLFSTLMQLRNEFSNQIEAIEAEIQLVLNKEFDAHKGLQEAITKLQDNPEWYQFQGYGDIVSCVRFYFTEFPIAEHEYLEVYLAGLGYHVSVGHSTLMQWQGTDNYLIKAFHGRDNGVWQEGKKIFDVEEFVTEGNEDTEKLYSLIEQHMEGAGVFPSVFRVSLGGELELVNTRKELANEIQID